MDGHWRFWLRCRQGLGVGAMLVLFVAPAGAQPSIDEAVRLQREGRNKEAYQAVQALLPGLRGGSDRAVLARALGIATDTAMALGEYDAAIQHARNAFDTHQALGQQKDAAWDLNSVGLAQSYLTRYRDALDAFRQALDLDRATGDGDGEMTRLNNIGNLHLLQGRYSDALLLYQDALGRVDERASASAKARLKKLTLSNLASLNQRLGADQRALDLYERVATTGAMQPAEEGQLLVNQGALVRRLGDPVKALALYRQAQAVFARARHRDGEISAWRNIGIVYALDLGDYPRALDAFAAALNRARASGNRRGEVQALLYHGETLRRQGRAAEAERELREALAGATSAGLVEEQWKAEYALGRVLESAARTADAQPLFEVAIAHIESVRSDVRTVALRSEFLADKRDVYDALIEVHLAQSPVDAGTVFSLVEKSRARTWQDRVRQTAPQGTLADVQRRLPADTLLLEYWVGPSSSATLWLSRTGRGVVVREGGQSARVAQQFADAVGTSGTADWREASAAAGRELLSGMPDLRSRPGGSLMIVPDGPLHFVPFEALTLPGGNELVLGRFDVSYLPSAMFLLRPDPPPARSWTWPWRPRLFALGDPDASGPDPFVTGRPLARLPFAAEEIRNITATMGGRADVHTGADARKAFVTSAALRSTPILHFATHAFADTRDPERSRLLLAPSRAGEPADFLFLREIYDLDLAGVQLASLSACETERGRVVRGEGVEGFSRALLAAGAASAVTTMWEVADRPSAEFMKRFYAELGQGQSKAGALRAAKLGFLRSELAWSHPRHWAGYVLNGDGQGSLPRVVPWSALVAVFSAACAVASIVVWRVARR